MMLLDGFGWMVWLVEPPGAEAPDLCCVSWDRRTCCSCQTSSGCWPWTP